MQIFARILNGKRIVLDVNNTKTIVSIKQKIQDKEGISTNQQCMIFAGKKLDGCTLQGHYIQKEMFYI